MRCEEGWEEKRGRGLETRGGEGKVPPARVKGDGEDHDVFFHVWVPLVHDDARRIEP